MYGPVRTVVWQGSAGDRRPYADQTAISESDGCGPVRQGHFPLTPLNRLNFTRFGAVARWDVQERARLILPNEDGGCKHFLRNLAAPLLEPARQVPRDGLR